MAVTNESGASLSDVSQLLPVAVRSVVYVQ